mmetsp:Transcript_6095/g.14794  ORF Transcript_6095/g.14794 Transcript_6095/m.14794 type:complete len:108 (-) Transcript_6095:391-714(-)
MKPCDHDPYRNHRDHDGFDDRGNPYVRHCQSPLLFSFSITLFELQQITITFAGTKATMRVVRNTTILLSRKRTDQIVSAPATCCCSSVTKINSVVLFVFAIVVPALL